MQLLRQLLLLGLLALSLSCSARQRSITQRERAKKVAGEQAALVVPPAKLPVSADGDARRGRDLVQRFECNRCHEATGFASAPVASNCFSCHEKILAGQFPVSATALARFRPHVASAREAPSLLAIGERFEARWLTDYLLAPRDLRPHLLPTMPRLDLDADQASDLAAYLTSSAGPGEASFVANGNAARGRDLMEKKACGACHAFGGVPGWDSVQPSGGSDTERARALAPDLRFTRERFRRSRLVAWLLDPKSIKPDTRMPNFGLTVDEAADIATYIWQATLAPEPHSAFVRLPPLTRPVSFEEVDRRVFSRTCHHCHTDADAAGGDGGPGNTGGFGFAPRGVSFSSHASILAGYLDERGRRRSLFEPLADGTPRLIAALLARHDEANRAPRRDVRGMPLALPPLAAEEIQLVESWVAQGKPL